jgi:hypothetical protein
MQIYHHLSTWNSVGVEHISTAALALYGAGGVAGRLAKAKARSAWANARTKARVKGGAAIYEKMVLEELSIDEAVDRIAYVVAADGHGDEGTEHPSPLHLLGTAIVKERVKKHLGLLFIESTAKDTETDVDVAERQETLEAARELGGRVGELGRTLERVWKLGQNSLVDVQDVEDDVPGVDGEIRALLNALVLFQEVFLNCDAGGAIVLRRALGNRVFEEWDGLEDARDRAVDMVVELERKSAGH